ncbi:TonB-dependent receptor [Sulfurimonas sp.]|uniref:TonB-dependent receptor n=1 Tax=Sulfurimonas sp. TaxID=2022749 RepID=UPI002B46A289|nr:TonB-dependent receptor [Sulfurimonas sp.]
MINKKKMTLSLITSLLLNTQIIANDVTEMEKLTVTAQKSEENAQKVPISISVFNDTAIEDKSISTLDDIAKYTPGLLLFNTGQEGLTSPSIRGIGANILSYSSPVSLYVDGVPTMNSFGFTDLLGDVQRIEVLKGPQGTLYGKNSEVGVINVITKKPDNETRAKVYTTLGNNGRVNIGANLSGAIIKDTLYLGVSLAHNEKDGFIKNIATGKYVNHKKNNYGKIYLRYTPTDNLEISVIASKSKNDNGAHDWASARDGVPEVSSNLEGSSSPETENMALKIDYSISSSSSIKSITTKRKHTDVATVDTDFTQQTIRHLYKDYEFNTISQEFRYEAKLSDIKMVSGVYFDKEDNDIYIKSITMFDPTGSRGKPQNLSSHSIGVFGNIIYPFADSWSLNTGIRYDKEDKSIEVKSTNIQLNKSWSHISPKISLQYTFDKSSMTYITIANGYRAGGFNPHATQNKKSYDEESLLSYELGYKGMFFSNTIKFNASAYYMSINDMQVEETLIPGIVYMVNAASATSKGVELEFEALLNSEFTFFANGGFNDTTFDKFTDHTGDYSGNTNPYAPKYNFNLGTQYRNSSGYYGRVDLNGYGKTYFDKANKYYQDAYELVNIKIGYEAEHYDIYLYADNLFDKEHNAPGAYFRGTTTIFKQEREVGIKLAYRY